MHAQMGTVHISVVSLSSLKDQRDVTAPRPRAVSEQCQISAFVSLLCLRYKPFADTKKGRH